MSEEQGAMVAAAAAAAKEVAKDAYNDLGRSALGETGKLLGLIPQAINRALLPVYQWVEEGKYKLEETRKILENKLENIPPEKIISPEPYIAVPVLQAISYSMNNEELREMFANLLATSMNKDRKQNAHPAFVEIIKQLTPDEAKILKYIQERNDEMPLVDIMLMSNIPGGGYSLVASNLSTLDTNIDIECVDYLPAMLENLERLKLIEISNDEFIVDENLYESVKSHHNVQKILERFRNQEIDFKEKCFRLTTFGRAFCSICLSHNYHDSYEYSTNSSARNIKGNSYALWEVHQALEKI